MWQGRLASANIGDSGFIVLGRTKERPQLHKKYHSPQQEHQFGYPYQLGHHGKADSPNDAMLLTLPVCGFFKLFFEVCIPYTQFFSLTVNPSRCLWETSPLFCIWFCILTLSSHSPVW